MSNTIEDLVLLAFLAAAIFLFPIAPAYIARAKGYSFIAFYGFAFLCLVPAIIVIMILPNRGVGPKV